MLKKFSVPIIGVLAALVLLLASGRGVAQYQIRVGTAYAPSPGWTGFIDTSPYYTIRVPVDINGYPYRHYSYHASGNLPTYMTSINYPTIYGSYGYRFAPGRFDYSIGGSEFSTAPTIYGVIVPSTSTLTAARVLPETAATPLAATATITVRVPADAEVRFDGVKTAQAGSVRTFVTPLLDPATKYAYDISATWLEKNREVTRTRHVELSVGDPVTVDFAVPSEGGRSTLRTQPLP
jgi:uncharacterized protein (TIGR03000 family)